MRTAATRAFKVIRKITPSYQILTATVEGERYGYLFKDDEIDRVFQEIVEERVRPFENLNAKTSTRVDTFI